MKSHLQGGSLPTDNKKGGIAPPSLAERVSHHAAPFLAAITHHLAYTDFATFDDKKTDHRLFRRFRHALLADYAPELDRLNRAGAGVFFGVNQTDGYGGRKENIIALRAWYADLEPGHPFDMNDLPLQPSIVVRTSEGGGRHLYWLPHHPLDCTTPELRAEHEADLRGIAAALAPFGADAKVCDVSRVLRLPGFYHRKGEPHLVRLDHLSGDRYTREDIRAAFPKQDRPPVDRWAGSPPSTSCRAAVLSRAARYLAALPPAIQGQNGSGTTFITCLKLMEGFDLTEHEAIVLMLDHFNPRCTPPWSLAELRHKAADAQKIAMTSPRRGWMMGASHA